MQPISLQLPHDTYLYARELPAHKHRVPNKTIFTGTGLTNTNYLRNARTLGIFLEMFLLNKHIDHPTYPPHFPGSYSPYHTHALNPNTFIDARTPDLQQDQLDLGFTPGEPPYSYAAREWPTWTTHIPAQTQTYRYMFTYPTQVLDAAYTICLYWHIPSLGQNRHKSKASALASLLDTLSCGYLTHPLLPQAI